MKIIVDVNVVVSTLLNKGIPFNVFFLNSIVNKFEFFAPEFLLAEFEKHEQELIEETKFSKKEFGIIKDFLFKEINFVSKPEFSEFLSKANELLKTHVKDIPYVALALKLNAPIFSGDKVLKNCIPDKVLSPREMLDILFKDS